ncbi:glycosyltransferase [Paenibacillus sinopodophylli]|uniref:glycosyltransferase n=1 Tax=Paenibacillus sinopodophylli TaxID=1837342 RepID=UPI00110CCA58|nr:glycosyltransferase family 2 protein [Paenibacillus sinopodophylli]
MLLGVHLIVRNEADVLERCLQSVKAFADEVIVADTGSSDETKEIAQRMGARVIDVVWEDDFAKARNEALQHARTLWVLVLDADEWLEGSIHTGKQLREELKRTREAALRLKMEHLLEEDEAGSMLSNEALRIFRADRGFAYVGEIHEQLVRFAVGGAGRWLDVDGPLAQSEIVIRHDGYQPAVIARKEKAIRNERIIARQLSERPNDPFCLYNYGVALCQLGRLAESSEAFGHSLAEAEVQAPYRPTLVRDYAKVLLSLQRTGQAEALLAEETSRYADYADLFLWYGDALRTGGMLLEAKKAYEDAIAVDSLSGQSKYISEAGAGGVLPRLALAEIELALGLFDQAQTMFEQVLRDDPRSEPGYDGLAACLQLAGRSDVEICEYLLSISGTQQANEYMVARSLTRIGAYESALPLWQKVWPAASDEASQVEDMIFYARALIGEGKIAEAGERLLGMLESLALPIKEGVRQLVQNAAIVTLLCNWNNGCPLAVEDEDRFMRLLGSEASINLKSLEKAVFASPVPKEQRVKWVENGITWLSRLLGHAVSLAMLQLAERLVQDDERLALLFEHALYDEGYKDAAADRMLCRYSSTGELEVGHWFRLGELLYSKGLFSEALGMFEQGITVSEQQEQEEWAASDTVRRMRLGAAAASLQLAMEALSLAGPQGSRSWDGSWAESDADKLHAAQQRIAALGWRTKWNGMQRRRANGRAAEADFLMHDREG